MMGQVKGEKYKPLTLTQTDFILASALHEKYLYLTPQTLVNPLFKMTVGKMEENIIIKY